MRFVIRPQRASGGHQSPGPADPILGVCAALHENTLGEGSSCFHVLNVVHELESLHGRITSPPYGTTLLPVRAVKSCHEWGRRSTLQEGIKAPPVEIVARSLFIVPGIARGNPTGSQILGG